MQGQYHKSLTVEIQRNNLVGEYQDHKTSYLDIFMKSPLCRPFLEYTLVA